MPDSKARTKTGKRHFVAKAMREFKEGDMKSSSGQTVTNPKQAVAIALNQTGQSKPKRTAGPKRNPGPKRTAETGSRSSRIVNEIDRRVDARQQRG